jgi:hypothetical protein
LTIRFRAIATGDNPHTSSRLFDAIAAGTPPLIIGDLQSIALPFPSIVPWEQLFPIVPEAVFFASIRKAVAATLDTAADHGGPGRVAGFYVCPAPGSALVNRTACRRRAWDDVAAVLPNLARELLWEVEGSRVAENVLLQARQQCGKVSRSCAEPQNAARGRWSTWHGNVMRCGGTALSMSRSLPRVVSPPLATPSARVTGFGTG